MAMRQAAEKNTCESKMLAWEIGFLSRISELETGREPTWMSKASHLRSTPSGSWTPGAPLRSAITPGGETEASWEEKNRKKQNFFTSLLFFFQEFLTTGAVSSRGAVPDAACWGSDVLRRLLLRREAAETAALGILFGFKQPRIWRGRNVF